MQSAVLGLGAKVCRIRVGAGEGFSASLRIGGRDREDERGSDNRTGAHECLPSALGHPLHAGLSLIFHLPV